MLYFFSLLKINIDYTYWKLTILVYSSTSFDRYIQLCNHFIEQFYYPPKLPSAYV